ncbi:MAG: MFS transporter [Mycobacteriales bacterium]
MAANGTTDAQVSRAGRREWVGLAVLALACLLYVMDLTVLHLAVPSISAELKPSSTELLWIIDIYGFMVAGFLVTMGNLGDRFGRRKVLLIGAAAFGAVSVLAALSTSPAMLIGSRALLGIAGATVAPSTLSLIFSMFTDPKQRGIAIGVWISAFSAGSAVGPVFGGVLLERYWWGSVFLLSLPVMALLLILGPRVLPEYKDPAGSKIDLFSVVLSLLAILPLIFGLKQIAQNGVGVAALASIGVGLVAGAIFVRRQLSLATPLIDLRLFKIPAFSASLAINFLAIFVAIGYFLFVAQYLQLVLGLTPLRAGLSSVPSALAFVVGSNVAPLIVRRVRAAYVMGVSLGIATFGLVILTRVGRSDGLTLVVVGSVIISLGLAPVLSLTTELIVGSAPPERAGAASGVSETGAELGGALGLSLLGTVGVAIYRARLTDNLPDGVPADAAVIARDTLGGAVAVAEQLPQYGAEILDVAQRAFVDGMHVVTIISAVFAAATAVMSVVMLRHVASGADRESAAAHGSQANDAPTASDAETDRDPDSVGVRET